MFDFRLKVFFTVAKRLNFTKDSEELYITQPADNFSIFFQKPNHFNNV